MLINCHTYKGKPFGKRWARNINTKMRNWRWQLRDNFLTWRRMKQWYLFCHNVLSDLEFIFIWFQSISLAVNTSSLFQSPLMSIWVFPFTLPSFDHTLKKFKPHKCILELFTYGSGTLLFPCLLVLYERALVSCETYILL